MCLQRLLWTDFVYPGHTLYTHAQLLLVLANGILANATMIVLFLGRDSSHCTQWATILAGLATAISSLCATLGRLLFR